MAHITEQFANFFHAITVQLASLTSAVHSQGVANIAPSLLGDYPKEFKAWVKAIQRYKILTGVDGSK